MNIVDNYEDIPVKGEDILCFDGELWHVDFVDPVTFEMANGTNCIAWKPI